jgi:protein O-GlcNAc transferase
MISARRGLRRHATFETGAETVEGRPCRCAAVPELRARSSFAASATCPVPTATPTVSPDPPAGRAQWLFDRGAFSRAARLLRQAVAGGDRDARLRLLLGKTLFQLGQVSAAVRELEGLARTADAGLRRAALGKVAVYIPGDPRADNRRILEARRRWAALEAAVESPPVLRRRPARASRRRLRIGYVSAFFAFRNWMKPVWGVLAAHDRSAFEVHLFIDRGLPAPGQGYAHRDADRVHAIDGLSNAEAARLVAAAGIDVLVDLNGYTYASRIGLLLRRPAPVQLGWFTYFATSGLGALDYLVADKAVLPAREERFCTEQVLRVSGTWLPFSVGYRVPRVVEPPCARRGRVTFGCLAPLYKITGGVRTAFARILRGAPNADLLLKSQGLGNAENRAAVRRAFRDLGIAPERLVLEGPAGHLAFLRAYSRIDVALDTFPYNGGTTTAEALWQGVPVLTFAGDRWVSRISRSLLAAAGLDAWVCASKEAFVRRAVALANDPGTPERLRLLRATQRETVRRSAACDVAGLCRQLESFYRQISAAPTRRAP